MQQKYIYPQNLCTIRHTRYLFNAFLISVLLTILQMTVIVAKKNERIKNGCYFNG